MALKPLRPGRRKLLLVIALGCGLLAFVTYNLPFVNERVGWRIEALRAQVRYALFPPERVVFAPNPTLAAMVQATLAVLSPPESPTPSLAPAVPTMSVAPTVEPTPVPDLVQLRGVRFEYQLWNNCGPANLAMALSFWGWQGDQRPIAFWTKPNTRDKNVMPEEMAAFVQEQTQFHVVARAGGGVDLLKSLVAAGFPVLVEKGFEEPGFEGWAGHYVLVTGYDDLAGGFTLQDSFIGPDQELSYDDLYAYWRHFNYTYLVVYPLEREAQVMGLLASQANLDENLRSTAEKALEETLTTTGRDQFFAWFNRGSSLVALQDYGAGTAAYDQAFRLYADLEPETRPWRLLWYEDGPYQAYFHTGRYEDVINLATQTLDNTIEPVLEESYLWRGLAREALGDLEGATQDLREALLYHPGWEPALTQLGRIGAAP